MPVTFDSISTTGTGAVNGFSFYHSAGGDNRFVILTVHSNGSLNANASGVYGGQVMNRLDFSLGNLRVWYLVNPPTGTQRVDLWLQTLTRSATAAVASYAGVNQVAPISSGTRYATEYLAVANSYSVTGTANENEMFIDLLTGYDNITTWYYTPTAGQTIRGEATPAGQANRQRLAFTDRMISVSGTVVNSWYLSGTTVDAIRAFGAALVPTASAPTGTPPTGTGAVYGIQFRSYILGLGD